MDFLSVIKVSQCLCGLGFHGIFTFFTGWTGGGCSDTGDCTLIMNVDTEITATFDNCSGLAVRIKGVSPVYYSTLQHAYDAAEDNDTIQSHAGGSFENLYINRDISIDLEGGYDCNYGGIVGETTINGMMTISHGTVTINNFILK